MDQTTQAVVLSQPIGKKSPHSDWHDERVRGDDPTSALGYGA
ncbi:MAG: hypothetical protein Q8L73_12580 [Methylotenera sp.]|nr:hypothetical protein [Methylotenera sp.]